jgi:hypothetical protein
VTPSQSVSLIFSMPPEFSDTGQIRDCPQWRRTMATFTLFEQQMPGDLKKVPAGSGFNEVTKS